ncbi:MAG: hypothetical protein SCK28_00930, partial [Bacillota bacterium]|nr:hypothetical protein [Bacillota bacterium]
MDIHDLTLDRGKTTTVHGKIYGLDYLIEEDDYFVKIFLDFHNKRLIVLDYRGPNIHRMSHKLDFLVKENNFDKVFIKAKLEDWEK